MGFSHVLAALVASYAAQVAASCAYGTTIHPRAEGEGAEVEVNTFGYKGLNSPLNWIALDPTANALCSTGTMQSPIDMVDGVFLPLPATDVKLEVADMPEGTDFENLGTTVEVVAEDGGSMTAGNFNYKLQQFHFHLPSEHIDNGTQHNMEMHMVFQTDEGNVGVLGVYIDVKDSPSTVMLDTLFGMVGQIATPGTKVKTPPLVMSEVVDSINAGTLQAYAGSLTTPPCSEFVQWLLSDQVLSVSAESFNAVRDVIGFNARYPQNKPGQPNLLQVGAASMQMAASAQHVLTAEE